MVKWVIYHFKGVVVEIVSKGQCKIIISLYMFHGMASSPYEKVNAFSYPPPPFPNKCKLLVHNKSFFYNVIQSPTKSLKSRPDSGKALSLKTYKAPLTSVTPDEPSSTKAELEKSYKRIADLEIRVHDLSTATSMVRLSAINSVV